MPIFKLVLYIEFSAIFQPMKETYNDLYTKKGLLFSVQKEKAQRTKFSPFAMSLSLLLAVSLILSSLELHYNISSTKLS